MGERIGLHRGDRFEPDSEHCKTAGRKQGNQSTTVWEKMASFFLATQTMPSVLCALIP